MKNLEVQKISLHYYDDSHFVIKRIKISKRKRNINNMNNVTNISNYNLFKRYIILPTNTNTDIIKKELNNLTIQTVTNSSKAIRNIINNNNM